VTVLQDARHLAWLIRAQFGLPGLIPELTRLLADGEPVTVEQAAAAGGWTVEQLRAELSRHPSIDRDDAGRIVGFGLTLRPTPHTFTTAVRTVYAFCASDALTFPILLDRPGVIRSTCPVTDQPVRVDVTPDDVVRVEPAAAVVSKLRPDRTVADVRLEICALGTFIASRDAAADWLDRHPEGEVASIAEDFEVNRRAMAELGWIPSA
jgi:alkylmercury lyase